MYPSSIQQVSIRYLSIHPTFSRQFVAINLWFGDYRNWPFQCCHSTITPIPGISRLVNLSWRLLQVEVKFAKASEDAVQRGGHRSGSTLLNNYEEIQAPRYVFIWLAVCSTILPDTLETFNYSHPLHHRCVLEYHKKLFPPGVPVLKFWTELEGARLSLLLGFIGSSLGCTSGTWWTIFGLDLALGRGISRRGGATCGMWTYSNVCTGKER